MRKTINLDRDVLEKISRDLISKVNNYGKKNLENLVIKN